MAWNGMAATPAESSSRLLAQGLPAPPRDCWPNHEGGNPRAQLVSACRRFDHLLTPSLCSSLCTPPEDQTLPGGPSAAAARHKQQRTSSTRRQRDESVSVIRFWRTWHPVQLCRTPIATLTISVHLSRSHESAPVRLPHAALRNGIRCWPRRLAVPPRAGGAELPRTPRPPERVAVFEPCETKKCNSSVPAAQGVPCRDLGSCATTAAAATNCQALPGIARHCQACFALHLWGVASAAVLPGNEAQVIGPIWSGLWFHCMQGLSKLWIAEL